MGLRVRVMNRVMNTVQVTVTVTVRVSDQGRIGVRVEGYGKGWG